MSINKYCFVHIYVKEKIQIRVTAKAKGMRQVDTPKKDNHFKQALPKELLMPFEKKSKASPIVPLLAGGKSPEAALSEAIKKSSDQHPG
jgi:hypothetical protein